MHIILTLQKITMCKQFINPKIMKLKPKTIKVEFTFDELYQMNKLYETMLDMDMTEDLPKEIETSFDKIREAKQTV